MKSHRLFAILSLIFFIVFQGQSQVNEDNLSKLSPRLIRKLSSLSSSSQALKVWIYFENKGESAEVSLKKCLAQVQQSLPDRCRWRRLKVREESRLVDYEDLPLYFPYAENIITRVNRVRAVSRWLNALSAEAGPQQIYAISELSFVKAIDLVKSFKRNDEFIREKTREETDTSYKHPIYGRAYDQLNQIKVPSLHLQGLTGKGVLVCMLDTGFRKSHHVFRFNNVLAEWDFVHGDNDVEQNRSDPKDYSDSHGTGTWSILGGFSMGELVGVAFEADFILAKTEMTELEEPIEEDYWVAGIEWAESLGAEVVSSSLGYTDWYKFKDMDGKTAVTTRAANRAVNLGVVVVNAVGNERENSWAHIIAPSDGFEVIAVGAVDASGKVASFSSPGPTYDGRIKPEVCALGVRNWVAANRNDGSDIYRTGSGTSFATPLVGGVTALLLQAHRDWTPRQVRAALMNTASNASSPNNDYGWGIVNAEAAANQSLGLARAK